MTTERAHIATNLQNAQVSVSLFQNYCNGRRGAIGGEEKDEHDQISNGDEHLQVREVCSVCYGQCKAECGVDKGQ